MQAPAEASLRCPGKSQQLPAFLLRQAGFQGGVIVCCQLELLFKAVHRVLYRCTPDKLSQPAPWGKGQAHGHRLTKTADAPQPGVYRVVGRRVDHSGVVRVGIADIPVQLDAAQLHLIAPVSCPDVLPAGHAVILGQGKPGVPKTGDPAIGCKLHLLQCSIQHRRDNAAVYVLSGGFFPAAVQPSQKKHHGNRKNHSIAHSVLPFSFRLSRRC